MTINFISILYIVPHACKELLVTLRYSTYKNFYSLYDTADNKLLEYFVCKLYFKLWTLTKHDDDVYKLTNYYKIGIVFAAIGDIFFIKHAHING